MTSHRGRPCAVALAAIMLVVVAGCDRGDGRTLDDPRFPPPVTTVPATTLPAGTELPNPGSPGTGLPGTGSGAETGSLQLVAPWPSGAAIPARYTCDGDDVAPALAWSGVPAGTMELALTVTDADAGGFVHWIVSGIDPALGWIGDGTLPAGSATWASSFGDAGWGGPCPPDGEEHRYVFTLRALNQPLEAADDLGATEVVALLDAITAAQTSVTGTYARAA